METLAYDRTPDAAVGEHDKLPLSLHLDLVVQNPETIAELCAHEEGEPRERFALEALRIGVLALKSARGQLDADLVRRESDRLLHTLEGTLQQHAQLMNERLTGQLKEYFDPHSGRFQERVDRLIRKDGELEQLLRRQIGAGDSELCRTLTAHLGQDSPLLRQLNPDESQGVLAALRKTLDEQLALQREQVLNQFSLDNKDGALARLVAELTDHNGQITGELQNKIDRLMKEFSLNEEESALNRLVRNVKQAQETIVKEFSLNEQNSALARLKRELLDVHESHRRMNQAFQEEVKLALEKMNVRKQESELGPRHGLEFEEAVFEFILREAQHAGDVATHTGHTVGRIKHSKVGDAVIELGPETAAPGARLVVEAKEQAGYTLEQARAEMETARKNRDAQVGLFVFSSKSARDMREPLRRLGQDVFVVWDPEDPSTDVFLSAGCSLARALCVRQQKASRETLADFTQIDRAILEIEKKAGSLDDIEKCAETIKNQCDKILAKVRTARKAFTDQIEALREHTSAVGRFIADLQER